MPRRQCDRASAPAPRPSSTSPRPPPLVLVARPAGAWGERRARPYGSRARGAGHRRGGRARAGARALAGWLASGRIGSCSCPPLPGRENQVLLLLPWWNEMYWSRKCRRFVVVVMRGRGSVTAPPPARWCRRSRWPAEPRDRDDTNVRAEPHAVV
jgi:hypothetical protein